jgi:hypothetical protein
MHPFRGGCLLGQLRQESRGVAAESTKFRDHNGNEAGVGANPHPLRVLLELGLLTTAYNNRATSGDGWLETPNGPEITASRASLEPRMP